MHFLTARLNSKDISDMQKLIPRRDLVTAWRDLEDHAKGLAKRLTSKEAATPSRTWKVLFEARPGVTLFLAVRARQHAGVQEVKHFFDKGRRGQQRIPIPEVTARRRTPQ